MSRALASTLLFDTFQEIMSRFPSQVKDGPNLTYIMNEYYKIFEEVIEAAADIMELVDINTASGIYLDLKGSDYAINRNGLSDPAFRTAILATIGSYLTNAGTIPSVREYIRNILPGGDTQTELDDVGGGNVILRLLGNVAFPDFDTFVIQAFAAGVGVQVELILEAVLYLNFEFQAQIHRYGLVPWTASDSLVAKDYIIASPGISPLQGNITLPGDLSTRHPFLLKVATWNGVNYGYKADETPSGDLMPKEVKNDAGTLSYTIQALRTSNQVDSSILLLNAPSSPKTNGVFEIKVLNETVQSIWDGTFHVFVFTGLAVRNYFIAFENKYVEISSLKIL